MEGFVRKMFQAEYLIIFLHITSRMKKRVHPLRAIGTIGILIRKTYRINVCRCMYTFEDVILI